MDSLGENEFCETNVKEGAKPTNDSLSFLFGKLNQSLGKIMSPNPNFFTVFKYIQVMDFKNTFGFPTGPPVPELQGHFW